MAATVQFKFEALGGGVFAATSQVHTFGTDALLLADFSSPKPGETVCDLCSGCGIIPLLLLRNGVAASAAAVEIQADACELIKLGAEKSLLTDKINIFNSDLRKLKHEIPANSFSLITVNPPYFAVGSGYESAAPEQQLIRSEVCCTLPELAECAARLLRSGGRLCLCHRPERLTDVIYALRENRLEPKRLRFITKRAGDAPWLFLLEARLDAKPSLTVEKPLDTSDTAEMKRIYGGYAC